MFCSLSFGKWDHSMQGNPRQSITVDSTLWIQDSRYWSPNPCQWNLGWNVKFDVSPRPSCVPPQRVGVFRRFGLKTGIYQPPPQTLRFSHGRGERETRVTGDEPQGTLGRVQTFFSSRLPLRVHFHRKRDVWVRGREYTLLILVWNCVWFSKELQKCTNVFIVS